MIDENDELNSYEIVNKKNGCLNANRDNHIV